MNKSYVTPIFIAAFFAFGNLIFPTSNAAVNNLNSDALNAAAPNITPQFEPTPPCRKPSAAAVQKSPTAESLPEKIDAATAVSPVYQINSKNCTNHNGEGSEGEDILRRCKGYGDYYLRASGFDYRINYGIESNNPKKNFLVMLFPLDAGAAAKYVRADLYDQKLADRIEWRLNTRGKPFAVIVRASFYKNIGSAKTFSIPKNKVAEFVFVRGLAGYEDLKEDLPTVNTAYNPDEQARMLAAKYLEKNRK